MQREEIAQNNCITGNQQLITNCNTNKERSSDQQIVQNIMNMKGKNEQESKREPSMISVSQKIKQRKTEKCKIINKNQFRSNPAIVFLEMENDRQFSQGQTSFPPTQSKQIKPQQLKQLINFKYQQNSTKISEKQSEHNSCSIKNEPSLNLYYENQKIDLMSRITSAINFLGKGIEVKKICFFVFKIEPVVIYFAEDFKFMAIFIKSKQSMKVHNMTEFLYVDSGFRTTKFQQYRKKGYNLNEQLCFSLIFRKRSFDFEASSIQIRDKIVEHTKFMKTCI